MDDEEAELEMIRRRKLAELQGNQQQEEALARERAVVEEQKRAILLKIMTPDAKERLNRVKLAYPDMGNLVENQLVMLYQSGRLPGEINDEQLKKILSQLQPKKGKEREIRFIRK